MTFHGDFDPRSAPSEVWSGSLWLVEKRSDEGGEASYHGNFIPDIPYQLIRRYTKPGDVVLDCFAGSGTTLEVGKKLGREVIGSDIFPQRPDIVRCDAEVLELDGEVDLIILHPPYWNIVPYTHYEDDLSNACDLDAFLHKLWRVVTNVSRYLPSGRFLSIVMADIYTKGELILLPFECSRVIRDCGYRLKSDVVKNVGSTQGKNFGQGGALWRYRALQNNFCTFEHEHVMTFERM